MRKRLESSQLVSAQPPKKKLFQERLTSKSARCQSEVISCKAPVSELVSPSYVDISPSLSPDSFPDIVIPNYNERKSDNSKWESPPLVTSSGYPYRLLIRPNGLKFTKGYGKCLGIWFKPEPYDLEEPVTVELSIRVKTPDGSRNDKLVIPMKKYSWDRSATTRPNPAFCFDLMAIKHEDIVAANCIDSKGNVKLVVEELGDHF